jgi:hypothetical protein
LTKIYSYADIAYVGGGFGNPGVHNVLEPATFGESWLYSHFAEAIALVNMGVYCINNQQELNEAFENLIRNEDIRHGDICAALLCKWARATTTLKKICDNVSTFKQSSMKKTIITHAKFYAMTIILLMFMLLMDCFKNLEMKILVKLGSFYKKQRVVRLSNSNLCF